MARLQWFINARRGPLDFLCKVLLTRCQIKDSACTLLQGGALRLGQGSAPVAVLEGKVYLPAAVRCWLEYVAVGRFPKPSCMQQGCFELPDSLAPSG